MPLHDLAILDSFTTTFPLGAGENGVVTAGGIAMDRIVLLLTGPFPPPEHRAGFAQDAIRHLITSTVGPIETQGSVPVHLFSTTTLSDDTKLLTGFLNAHVYGDASATRVFATLGPFQLSPPMGQVLLCAINR